MNIQLEPGRPPVPALRPEDAETIRKAVKAAARYFGIKIEAMAGGQSWVRTAMRSKKPLSVRTAYRLFQQAQCPELNLIGGKRPQGPPLEEAQEAILLYRDDPAAHPLPINATVDYVIGILEAGELLNRYWVPLPGTALFVMPGSALSLSESLVDSFAEDLPSRALSTATKRKLVRFLEHHFGLAERPLRSDQGKSVLMSLVELGIQNRKEIDEAIAAQLPNEHRSQFPDIVRHLFEAEVRRAKALGTTPPQRRTGGKRKVTLRRNIDAVF